MDIHWSTVAFLSGDPRWLIDYLKDIELELRGLPWDYNWWVARI